MKHIDIREQLVSFGGQLCEEGLVAGPGGNISARAGELVYLSPSGFSFLDLSPDDYVGLDLKSGEQVEGKHRPTSEYLMHLNCYRKRPEVRAVFHTHPRYTLALTCTGEKIRPVTAEFHIFTHTHFPYLDYITPTTNELAEAVGAAAGDGDVMVLRNHGALTMGTSMKEAYYRMAALEEGAQLQWMAARAGTPRFLGDNELKKLDNLEAENFRRELAKKKKGFINRRGAEGTE